ncbi:hypothetical protein BOTBODRAFT_37198 [Botryobasidium botryosum FD-172 SS1]|uniref:Intradiol ring-cleavage dioxygenases domain-containing protein n=1 Tax=Botryobasidium botryosum (strain FD-172 SS1) TaxID=930990 RepID=A0A067M3K6_BOTB1|nr:hypothetical protein BOTBODRAFT_37198 [Botryobasidium botryosum FD-172 SS1]
MSSSFDPSKYPELKNLLCSIDKIPDVSDIRPETVTEKVIECNSNCPDPRLKTLLDNLTIHLHDFIRENNVTTEEWMATVHYLTDVGKKCTGSRQEFVLLSDIFGIAALVNSINNPSVNGSTVATLLGPFYTGEFHDIEEGGTIAPAEGPGEPLLVTGRILNTSGEPIPNAAIETWEADAEGLYDVQYSTYSEPDHRGRFRSNDKGEYSFRCIVPIAYAIPDDGPVGDLLIKLGRHPYRPAHLHMKIEAPPVYETLVTALYPRGDLFSKSDAVFGVKTPLIVDFELIESDEEAKAKGFKKGPFRRLDYDFTLATKEESAQAKEKLRKSMAKKA